MSILVAEWVVTIAVIGGYLCGAALGYAGVYRILDGASGENK